MKKQNFSLNQIFKEEQKICKSFFYKAPELICPICKKTTFKYISKYQIGYCTNKDCDCFSDLYSRKHKKENEQILKDNCLEPILQESYNHTNDFFMKKEMETYCLNNTDIKKYNIGYYPKNYWVKKNEEWNFGKIIFPMRDYDGSLINICGKNIGKESKLPNKNTFFAYQNNGGIYNYRGIWNEKILIFFNPISCLLSLKNNNNNSIFINENFYLPSIVTFQSVLFFYSEKEIDIMLKVKDLINKFDKNIIIDCKKNIF